MLLTAITLPLFSSFLVLLFGRFFNKTGVSIMLLFSLINSVGLSATALIDVVYFNNTTLIFLGNILTLSHLTINLSVITDYLSVIMVFMVGIISLLVHAYSVEYMWHDPHFHRFMAYLSLFTYFMFVLLTSVDMFQFFIGWEGVGLCSFLLIGFWFTRTQASTSALKAFIINRVGDSAFLVGLLIIALILGSLDLRFFLASKFVFENNVFAFLGKEINLPRLLVSSILIGAMSKSAQIFLHTWLPDAMEGPTPVSSLIHAATMVAAGIFLIVRVSIYLVQVEDMLSYFSIIGSLTAIFAATSGLFQYDIKKIIAYSTCSQLGFMMAAAGFGVFGVSIYHLLTHAFFKALLFLVAGSIIHSLADVQDIRRYGSLIAMLPYSYVTILLASMALTGIPFFSGFYSKDLIIEVGWVADFSYATFSTLLLITASAFTMLYSVKLIYMTFFLETNSSLVSLLNARENGFFIVTVLFILSLFSIFIGWYLKVILFTNSGFLSGSTLANTLRSNLSDVDFLHYTKKQLVLVVILTACYFGILFNISEPNIFNKYWPTMGDNTIRSKVFHFFSKKWYFDNINNYFVTYNLFKFSYEVLLKSFEFGVLEFIGPYGLYITISFGGYFVEQYRTNDLLAYVTYLLYGVLLTLLFKFCNVYFILIAALVTFLMVVADHGFDYSFDSSVSCYISIYYPRKLVLISRRFATAVFVGYYGILPALFVLYSYSYVIFSIVYYYKYGDFLLIPPWIIIR